MGGFITKSLLPSGPLVSALVEAKVDQNLALKIGDALSNNNLKLFEDLAMQAMSDNNVLSDNKILNTLRLHLSAFSNNKMINSINAFSGDSLSGIAAICSMCAITLAMIFKDNVPFSLLVLTIVVFTIIIVGFLQIRNVCNNIKEVQKSLVSGAHHVVVYQEKVKQDGLAKFTRALLHKAGCNPNAVIPRSLVRMTTQIAAVGALWAVTEVSNDIVEGIKGRLDIQEDWGKMLTNGRKMSMNKKENLEASLGKISETIDSIRSVLNASVNRICSISHHGDDWAAEVKAAQVAVKRLVRRLPKRPVFLLTSKEKKKKEHIESQIEHIVSNMCGRVETALRKIPKVEAEIDQEQVHRNCNEMIKALAYDPNIERKQQEAINNAVTERNRLYDILAKASSELQKTKTEVDHISADLLRMKLTFDTKLTAINRRIDDAKQSVSDLGQGSITMRGRPPKDDTIAKELYEHWMSGRWKKLYTYSSGSFSVKKDARLTKAQTDATETMDQLVDEADALKKEYGEKMEVPEGRRSELKGKLDALNKKYKNAETDANKAERQDGPTWGEFKNSHPGQYAEIQLMYSVNKNVSKAAQWTFRASSSTRMVETILYEINEMDNVIPDVTLDLLKALAVEVANPSTSPIALLSEVGEFYLKTLLMPKVSSIEAVETTQRKLAEFDEIESHAEASATIVEVD